MEKKKSYIYEKIRPLRIEIDQLQALIDIQRSDLKRSIDPDCIQIMEKTVSRMQSTRKQLIEEHNAIIRDLEKIQEEDPEMYRIIYWHFVKGRSWTETFYKACPDLISSNPYEYTRSRFRRFMNRWEKSRTE